MAWYFGKFGVINYNHEKRNCSFYGSSSSVRLDSREGCESEKENPSKLAAGEKII